MYNDFTFVSTFSIMETNPVTKKVIFGEPGTPPFPLPAEESEQERLEREKQDNR